MDEDVQSEDFDTNISSDEESEFHEDAYPSDDLDSVPDEIPLTDAEVQDLVDELLVVESKTAEAQEMLEEESLNAIRSEVREELSGNLAGSELDVAVDEEMAIYVEQWQEALDELEDQSSLLQESLDAAGVDLCDLFKWIEKQAPQGCSTEAWKKRIHWAGSHASLEVSTAIRKADDDLNSQRPMRRHHGRSIEEGASGFLQKNLFDSSVSAGSETTQQLDDGWGSVDALLGNGGDIEKAGGYGTNSWARVYLAATPEQAALLNLPGADQVEEIIDLDKCKKDFLTAAAIASEKETGLTEQQKKNLRKVAEEEDIKKTRLVDRIILKCNQKKRNKSSCSVVGSVGPQIADATNELPDKSQARSFSTNDGVSCLDKETRLELSQKSEKGEEDSLKIIDKVIIEIDSDEDETMEETTRFPYGEKKSQHSFRLMDTVDSPTIVDNDGKSVCKNDVGIPSSEINMKTGDANLICTICRKELACSDAYKHPLLPVIVCLPCRHAYRNAEFTKDPTGSHNECCWCANGGNVIMCEKCDKVFCTKCIVSNLGEDEIKKVTSTEQWTCYCCNNETMIPRTGSTKSSEHKSSNSVDLDNDYFDLRTNGRHRKRLRRILDDSELEESTILKQKLEKERKERLDRLRESATNNSMVPVSSSLQECAINIARDSDEDEVLIPFGIAKFLKPHQIEGVRFMWDNCIESIEKVKSGDPGNGCILAHSMGLGKTLQVIAFLYTVLKKKDLGLRTALIVTPVNVLHNWPDEFEKWRPFDVKKISVYVLDESSRNVRKDLLNLWRKTGGVMMIGYTAFRTMSLGRHIKDGFEKVAIHKALKNPGPDILVCDEAHMIKNKKADITQALKQVNTQRRIALTGSPLQNNLMEYYCMVDFVREGFLGRPQDFKNRFQNPIENGQHADSTECDVKCMKERTHVLHKQLMGFVQRKGANIVEKELPKKIIYVLSIRLSQLQRALYNRFVHLFWLSNEQPPLAAKYRKCLFPTYHALAKVWNHPDLLFHEKDVLSEDSMDDSLSEDSLSSAEENNDTKKQDKRTCQKTSKRMESEIMKIIDSLDWCKDLISDVPHGELENSGKFTLLLHILSMSSAKSEKVLIFSQSLPTLDLVESFLEKIPRPAGKVGFWRKDKEWYRLDGHTKAKDRQKLVKRFNDPANSKVQCVLISTKAGSLGINLQAANRVVIIDGSWNPTHDIQALFRAWRFGQKKPVFVYRMLAYGTAEEKIYKRQVVKEGLAARVLDAQQVERHSKMEELKILFKLDDDREELPEEQNAEDAPEDEIMSSLMIHHSPKWIVRTHQHDALLEDREEEKLTLEEQALAWEKFKKITESSTFDWVEGDNGTVQFTSTSHVQTSWADGVQVGSISACPVKFHAELLATSNVKNNEHIQCNSCNQTIGWEHIVKGKSSITRRK